MDNYDYKEGLKRINDILESDIVVEKRNTIPDVDSSEYNFNNAIKGDVASIFIDIRSSSEYFKNNAPKDVARVMRAFCSEIIEILRQNERYKEIGIRGDCVYAIYSVYNNDHLLCILKDAAYVNTFQNMLQALLIKHHYNTFKIGIGLGYANDVMVAKAGKTGTGINDLLWIGNAVIDASNLSSLGNNGKFQPIILDELFYNKIKNYKIDSDKTFSDLFKSGYSYELKKCVYHGNVVIRPFNDWVNKGMK